MVALAMIKSTKSGLRVSSMASNLLLAVLKSTWVYELLVGMIIFVSGIYYWAEIIDCSLYRTASF